MQQLAQAAPSFVPPAADHTAAPGAQPGATAGGVANQAAAPSGAFGPAPPGVDPAFWQTLVAEDPAAALAIQGVLLADAELSDANDDLDPNDPTINPQYSPAGSPGVFEPTEDHSTADSANGDYPDWTDPVYSEGTP